MAYCLFLDKVQFPVIPSKITTKIKSQNKTMTLINEEEINFLKSPGLTEIKLQLLLPQTRYPFAAYPNGFQPPQYYLTVLEKLKTSKKSFQLIVTRTSPTGKLLYDTNMAVSLEEYEIEEDAKEGMDLLVSVELKQYRAYSTKTIKVPQPEKPAKATASSSRDSSSAPKKKTYTVKRGDCLWNIAKQYLGNGSRYKEIYNLNRDKIKNPNLIYPGQVLTLP